MRAPKASELDEILTRLFEAAVAARANAYARYSGFAVGAAILAEDGRIYAGANVENAAYPQGQCAEATAIGAMVTGGGRLIRHILVLGPAAVTPCGGCRQRIGEFADAQTRVHAADPGGVRRSFQAADLLPAAFGAASLNRDTAGS